LVASLLHFYFDVFSFLFHLIRFFSDIPVFAGCDGFRQGQPFDYQLPDIYKHRSLYDMCNNTLTFLMEIFVAGCITYCVYRFYGSGK